MAVQQPQQPAQPFRRRTAEDLAGSGDDVRALQQQHQDALAVIMYGKRMNRRTLVAFVVFVVMSSAASLLLGYTMFGGKRLNVLEMRKTVAKFDLLEPSSEYRELRRTLEIRITSLRLKLDKCGHLENGYRQMTSDEMDDCATMLYIYKRVDNIDPDLGMAIMAGESQFDMNLPPGAAGELSPWQILPSTKRWIAWRFLPGRKLDLRRIGEASEIALRYIVYLRDSLGEELGREVLTKEILWGYNSGRDTAFAAAKSGRPYDYINRITAKYEKRVMFYYLNYSAGTNDAYYDEATTNK